MYRSFVFKLVYAVNLARKTCNVVFRVLKMGVDPAIVRPQDIASVFSYVSRFYAGEALAWEFVQAEWFKALPRR